jgi:predicted DNA binding CopG/RHH family protein
MALNIPNFASEKEEADWWYDHREEVSGDFADAAAKGELRNLREVLLQDHSLTLAEAYVSIPMTADELRRVREVAASQGLGAEEFISRVVHEVVQSKQAA